jgi:S-DNA-T family DNA segregation ATPase FtsK/SpoIIIE
MQNKQGNDVANAVQRVQMNNSFAGYLGRGLKEAALWMLLCGAAYLVLSLVSYSPHDPGWSFVGPSDGVENAGGRIGAWFSDVFLYLFGYYAYLVPVMLAWSAVLLFWRTANDLPEHIHILALRWLGFVLTLAAGTALAELYVFQPSPVLPSGAGGVLGQWLSALLVSGLNPAGSTLFLIALFLSGFTLFTGLSWLTVMDYIGGWTLNGLGWLWRQVLRFRQTLAEPLGKPEFIPIARPQVQPTPHQRIEPTLDLASQKEPKADADHAIMPVPEPEPEPEPELKLEPELEPELKSEPEPEPEPEAVEAVVAEATPFAAELPPTATITVDNESLEAVDSMPWPVAETPYDPAPPAAASLTAADELTDEEDSEPRFASTATLDDASRADNAEAIDADSELAWEETTEAPSYQSMMSALASTEATPPRQPKPIAGYVGELPPTELLDEAPLSNKGYSEQALEEISRLVEARLADFGVSVEVVAVFPGPVVTLFELQLAPGTKASKITNLSRDLARALSVISLRVVEIIPGKPYIGLEVPNEARETVYLGEILRSEAYEQATSPLTLAIGKDISGNTSVADLARMPHALIAGTTGSGKSVAINTMILSLLFKSRPSDVRLIMIDPKMLELSVYEGIPHLLTPVVTDMKEAANALRWCVGEMERRYRLMSALGVRNIKGYNKKVAAAEEIGEPIVDPLFNPDVEYLATGEDLPTLQHLPYIVVIIDELADMMMVVGKKVEELIARLAQKARASGIHLLLATQRPSVDVLTGLIKANIPTRIAFQVSSRIDSRTVLDQMGAEHLLGHGDMLYLAPGGSIPKRVHGAFVDDHEVHKVVEYLKQQGGPDYIDTLTEEPTEHLPGIDPEPRDSGEEQDALFDEAVRIVTETRRASVSGVQRRLKIGYNRAARMIEEMERIGVVSAPESNGNREVLAPPPPPD